MEYLYVCHFSNGHIKVGRSIAPKGRIASHADRVACMGVELAEHFIVECKGSATLAEAELIRQCVEQSAKRNKSEWFEGLTFSAVCGIASACAETDFQAREQVVHQTAADAEKQRLAIAAILEHRKTLRYQIQWSIDPETKQSVHFWLDTTPEVPHWPESGVMRWDLRHKDWHRIWPELIDHPCAYLFAPTHPDRDGVPKFGDWIRSWPACFRPTSEMNAMVNAWDKSGEKRWDLRPDDWHRIWPELIGIEGAPEVPQTTATIAQPAINNVADGVANV